MAGRPGREVEPGRADAAPAWSHKRLAAVAVALLEAKAVPEERDEYNRFVLTLAAKVASAYGEGRPGDDAISSAERSTIDTIAPALGAGL